MDSNIIKKISKLLARADAGRNDNEHEREIAMRQAHALLAKHGLSMADVSEDEQAEALGAKGRTSMDVGRYVWKALVINQACKLNGCHCVRSARKSGQTVWIIGRHLHCTVAKEMSNYLINSITQEAKRNGHNLKDFGNGAAAGITGQVKRILADMKKGIVGDEQMSESTALVVVNQHEKALAEAKETASEFFPRTASHAYSSRTGEDYYAGKDYGSKVGLNRQVGGGAKRIGHG